MVGEMEGWPLDSLCRSLVGYGGKEIVVAYSGFRARVRLDSLTYPDEDEEGFGGWLAHVKQVIEDLPGNPYHEATLLDVSMRDPPLRVETIDGDIIWARISNGARAEDE